MAINEPQQLQDNQQLVGDAQIGATQIFEQDPYERALNFRPVFPILLYSISLNFYVTQIIYTTSPSRSLGSNHVLFGGITSPVSAIVNNC